MLSLQDLIEGLAVLGIRPQDVCIKGKADDGNVCQTQETTENEAKEE